MTREMTNDELRPIGLLVLRRLLGVLFDCGEEMLANLFETVLVFDFSVLGIGYVEDVDDLV